MKEGFHDSESTYRESASLAQSLIHSTDAAEGLLPPSLESDDFFSTIPGQSDYSSLPVDDVSKPSNLTQSTSWFSQESRASANPLMNPNGIMEYKADIQQSTAACFSYLISH